MSDRCCADGWRSPKPGSRVPGGHGAATQPVAPLTVRTYSVRLLRRWGCGAALAALAAGGLAAETGVCERTPQVRDAIVATTGAADCEAVAPADLEGIARLDLSRQSIVSLRANDFDGLAGLRTLDLSYNSIAEVPEGVFDPLLLLETLRLDNNNLASLPGKVFAKLFTLRELTLHGNYLAELPEGMFDALSRFAGVSLSSGPAPKGEPLDPLRRLIEANGATTVERFVAALPTMHKRNFVLVYESLGLGKEFVSGDHPRVISWGADGRFMFSWQTNPAASEEFRESVEFLHSTGTEWLAGVIDFSASSPEIRQPAVCGTCHGAVRKPLWAGGDWPGTEGDSEAMRWGVDAYVHTRNAVESTSPRLEPLEFEATKFAAYDQRRFRLDPELKLSPSQMPEVARTFAQAVAARHAEVMFEKLRAQPGYAVFARELMCRPAGQHQGNPSPHILADFATADVTPARLSHTLEALPGSTFEHTFGPSHYWTFYGGVQESVAWLAMLDLWRQDARIRDVARSATTPVDQEFVRTLRFPPGTATFQDELIEGYRVHFGTGGETFFAARNVHAIPPYMFWFATTFQWIAPRVCEQLRRDGGVVGFTLVDAEDDRDIRSIEDGAELDLSALPPGRRLTVRAEIFGSPEPARVDFDLDGPAPRAYTDDARPFALHGDDGDGDYRGGDLPNGDYRLVAAPGDGPGVDAEPAVAFTVKGSTNRVAVAGFTLVDADTGADVGRIAGGGVLDLSGTSGWYDIRADVPDYAVPAIREVRLALTGPRSRSHADNTAPYTLHGEGGGDLPNGSYRLVATPHPRDGGEAATPLAIDFTVAGSFAASAAPVTGFTLVDADSGADIGALADGVELRAGSGGMEIRRTGHATVRRSVSGWYDIRADVAAGRRVGSVRLALSGPLPRSRTDGAAPYTLHGGGGRELANGTYRLVATPYTEPGLGGDALPAHTVGFTVKGAFDAAKSPIGNFTLFAVPCAERPAPYACRLSWYDGDQWDDNPPGEWALDGSGQRRNYQNPDWKPTLPETVNLGNVILNTEWKGRDRFENIWGVFDVRANLRPGRRVRSVRLELTGESVAARTRTDNAAPYTQHGGTGRELPNGSYRLVATPYPEADLGGDALPAATVEFGIAGSFDDHVVSGFHTLGWSPEKITEASVREAGPAGFSGDLGTRDDLGAELRLSGPVSAVSDNRRSCWRFLRGGSWSPFDCQIELYNSALPEGGLRAGDYRLTARVWNEESGDAVPGRSVDFTVSGSSDDAASSDATLKSLALSGIDIGRFAAGTMSYTAEVEHDVTGTTVTAVANDADASATIRPSDTDPATGHQAALSAGANRIEVIVTAADGTTKTYTVTVTRAEAPSSDATLKSLTLSGIDIGTFAGGTTAYTASVAHDVVETTVAAVASDADAEVAIAPTDADAAAGHQVDLATGANAITVTVTAADDETTTYTVTVTREEASTDATLESLSLSGIDIAFSADTTAYAAEVDHEVTETTVTAAANDADAKVTIAPTDADAAAGHQVDLATGANAITVTVTAADTTTKTYTVTVTRAGAPPAVTTPGPFEVLEGDTAVATLSATDADTEPVDLSWSIPSGADRGADAAHFALTPGGALSFRTAKDFEAPDDADGDGAYAVTVRVTDGSSAAVADLTVNLADRNEAPGADAGPDQADVAAGATVTLSGSATDPDAGDAADTLTLLWTQTGGAAVTLSNAAAAAPTFTAPTGLTAAETLTFTLRATDDEGLYGEDAVAVTVVAGSGPTGALPGRSGVARRLDAVRVRAALQRGSSRSAT